MINFWKEDIGDEQKSRKAFWGFSKIHLYQQSPANVRESSLGTARYACLLDIFSQSENDRFCFAERIVPDLTGSWLLDYQSLVTVFG